MSWTYSKAGVDLDLHREMHKIALEVAKKVNSRAKILIDNLGGYTSRLSIGDKYITLHIDGVGTKSILASKFKKYQVIGWDCVTVNINDVICDGFKPIAVGNYIAIDKPDLEIYSEILQGIANASISSNIAIVGGETAILPDLIDGIDVSCSLIAIKNINSVGPKKPKAGSILVALPSTGLHANGYSLARKVIESTVGYTHKLSNGKYIWEELLKPTANYLHVVLEAYREKIIYTAAHISGGGFLKIKRILGEDLDAIVEAPKPPEIFKLLKDLGDISIKEMYRVFNMGIGMTIAISDKDFDSFKYIARKRGIDPLYIGEIQKGRGRAIIKTYTGEIIEL